MAPDPSNDPQAAALAVLARAPGLAAAAREVLDITTLAGLSNATFRIDTARGSFAVQLPGSARDARPWRAARRQTIAATRLAATLGIGAELVHADPQSGAIVTGWVAAAAPTTAEHLRTTPGAIEALAARFARLHGSGARLSRPFTPFAAIARLAAQAGTDALPADLVAALARARRELSLARARDAMPIHGDPVPANVLATPAGIVLIDWDHAGMGDPGWDIAYFALEAGLLPAEEAALAAAHGAAGLDPRRLALHKMTAAALAALWGAARMRSCPAPDLTDWIATRRAQALAMTVALYGRRGSR